MRHRPGRRLGCWSRSGWNRSAGKAMAGWRVPPTAMTFSTGSASSSSSLTDWSAKLVDKAAVRAIFQQAADEVGEQVAMATDRGIGPAMIAFLLHQPFEQPLAHAVQPLEFKIAPVAGPLDVWSRWSARCGWRGPDGCARRRTCRGRRPDRTHRSQACA